MKMRWIDAVLLSAVCAAASAADNSPTRTLAAGTDGGASVSTVRISKT